jgi:hypothetical protein
MPIIDHKNLKIVVSIALINNENEILLFIRAIETTIFKFL